MKPALVLPAAMLVLCLGCDSQQVAGTGSQTGNSVVAGRILPPDSSSDPVGVRVYLRPLSWTSGGAFRTGSIDSTWTDSTGRYEFPSVPSDTYRLEARGLRWGWSRTVRAQGSFVEVPSGTLQRWGRLLVEIEGNDSLLGGRLEFYGLDRVVDIPRGGGEIRIVVDSLPVGTQTLRVWLPSLSRMFCEAHVRIGPDSLSKIEYESWDRDDHGPLEDP